VTVSCRRADRGYRVAQDGRMLALHLVRYGGGYDCFHLRIYILSLTAFGSLKKSNTLRNVNAKSVDLLAQTPERCRVTRLKAVTELRCYLDTFDTSIRSRVWNVWIQVFFSLPGGFLQDSRHHIPHSMPITQLQTTSCLESGAGIPSSLHR